MVTPGKIALNATVLIACTTIVASCTLDQILDLDEERIVVVTGVMRPDLPYQFIIVEETLDGANGVPDSLTRRPVPPYGPHNPIDDATVTVSNLDLPDDPCGSPVTFVLTSTNPLGSISSGVYWSPANCPTMRTGDRLSLTVTTPKGDTITGTTLVPGMKSAFIAVGADSFAMGGGDSVLTFNRDRDTLHFGVDPIVGRLLQLDIRRNGDVRDFGAKLQVDTTGFSLPGDAVDIFFSGTGRPIFRGGRSYIVNLTLSDTNYYDYSRSQNSDFTGRGFINHLTGGLGVFGSAVAQTNRIWAVSDVDETREGVYDLTGRLDGATINAELRIFTDNHTEETEVSAFLEGIWFTEHPGGFLAPPWTQRQIAGKSVDGYFSTRWLHLSVPDTILPSTFELDITLDGYVSATDTFALIVSEVGINGPVPFDTLFAIRRPGQ